MTPVTVALVNDYELVLAGLATMLRPYRDQLVVLDRALERTPDRAVDISLFDTYGATDGQIERVRTLAEDPMAGTVVVFSFSTAPELVRASLGAGAAAFVSKTVNARQLADAIVTVAEGHRVVLTPAPHRHRDGDLRWPGRGRDLSARDSELLVLLRQGYTNKEIAERLYLSENTVKTHLRRLFHKLGVSNRTQAAMVATEDDEFRPRAPSPSDGARN
jgi:two-component system, NarL family, response regulator LiaR